MRDRPGNHSASRGRHRRRNNEVAINSAGRSARPPWSTTSSMSRPRSVAALRRAVARVSEGVRVLAEPARIRLRVHGRGRVALNYRSTKRTGAERCSSESAPRASRLGGARKNRAASSRVVAPSMGCPRDSSSPSARATDLTSPSQLVARARDETFCLALHRRGRCARARMAYGPAVALEQRALAQASGNCFAGGFTIRGVTRAVLALDGHPGRWRRRALVDHSLVWTRQGGTLAAGSAVRVLDFAAAQLGRGYGAERRRETATPVLPASGSFGRLWRPR